MNTWRTSQRHALTFAFALPVAWLIPPFATGIALSLAGLMSSESSDLPVSASLAWGYVGAVVVPLVALTVAWAARMPAWKSVVIGCTVAVAYAVGSMLAMFGIVAIEFSVNPLPSGWD